MHNKDILLIELHYLPCIQYFTYLNSFQNVIIDQNDRYEKQTYRNRCRINGANKIEDLIIPVKKSSSDQKLTRKLSIDNNQKWLNRHLRAIQSAYGKAPFFEYYADDFFEIIKSKSKNLFHLNLHLLTKCLEILELSIDLRFFELDREIPEKSLFDARNTINPKKSEIEKSIFAPSEYFQVFGKNFVQNLSIIDLIFCEGPQARGILKKSCALK